ncbi:MAG TPA: hypothetical protein VHA57_10710 [Actinomycetota bacterium]|nr:hypothetical protein [Actinomycetota bacterium]
MKGRYRTALRAALAGEVKAYGFALVMWSGGTLTSAAKGTVKPIDAVAYVCGALAAMVVVILATFGGPGATWETRPMPRYAFGALHIGSVLIAMLVAWAAGQFARPAAIAFLAAGFAGILTYQLLLGAEIAFSIAEDRSHRPNA